MKILGIDHIQLAIPKGSESVARAFYGEILDLTEVAKPESLKDRGGIWFENENLKVHLGVDSEFVPANKAHPGFRVLGLDLLAKKLGDNGFTVSHGSGIAGFK